jgi:hypothetical protein
MPIARCTDCGMGRRYKRPPADPRCHTCYRLRKLYLQKLQYDERRRKKLCAWCGDPLSPHSIFHCIACGAYHAGYQARLMREKRAKSPAYRKDEREKVRVRMQGDQGRTPQGRHHWQRHALQIAGNGRSLRPSGKLT